MESSSPTSKSKSVLPHKTGRLRDHFTIGKKLGQGQFGTTYLVTEKSTSKPYACKSIPKRKLFCREDYEDVWREIQILHHLSEHPNVVLIKDTFEDSVFVHLVMELCEGGELFDRIIKKGQYSEKEAAKLIKVIVAVVEACHSLSVMHRDLKPENFLFESSDEHAKLKAIDFGLSVFYKPGQVFSDVVGSPYYVAPEVLCKRYGPEIDVWSAGVILYILLSGVPPFWAETEAGIFREILKGKLDFESDPWPSISDSAKDLIQKMLDRDPKKRITAHEVLCHPWIVDDNVTPDKPLDSAVITRLKQFSAMNKLKKMALRVCRFQLYISLLVVILVLPCSIMSRNPISSMVYKFDLDRVDEGNWALLFRAMHTDVIVQAAAEIPFTCLNYELILKLCRIKSRDYLFASISFSPVLVIAEKLSEEEIGGLKELFKMIDTDNSGTITFEELKEGLKKVGSQLRESEIKALMDAADIDNSGSIDYTEFIAATLHLNKIEREENLVAAFNFFDKDGSGYITIDELHQACKDFGLGEVHLDDMIEEIDQDNDGRIDYAEFSTMMKKGNRGFGSTTMRGNVNFSMADAFGIKETE